VGLEQTAMPNKSDHDLLVEINTTVNSLYGRLYGDVHNEGDIEATKTRVKNLEEFKWKLVGALGLLGAITTTNVVAFIYFMANTIRVIK
jgi:hypothetical protein